MGINRQELPLDDTFRKLMLDPFLDTFSSVRTKNSYRQQVLSICSFFFDTRGDRYSFEQLDETDAKYYFHTHLVEKCADGSVTLRSCRHRLSVCKSFASYLEQHAEQLADYLPAGYHSPFANLYFQGVEKVRADHVLTYEQIDGLLSSLSTYDQQLFVIALLSYRMMLTQEVILSLKKEYFIFLKDHGRTAGMLLFTWHKRQVRKQIPSDLLEDLEPFVAARTEGHIFLNQRGNAMTPSNLSDLVKKFAKDTGMVLKLSELRKKGLIDLVAHNPDALDDISQYAGLSKEMIEEYGKVLDRIEPDCIADKAGFKILAHEKRGVL